MVWTHSTQISPSVPLPSFALPRSFCLQKWVTFTFPLLHVAQEITEIWFYRCVPGSRVFESAALAALCRCSPVLLWDYELWVRVLLQSHCLSVLGGTCVGASVTHCLSYPVHPYWALTFFPFGCCLFWYPRWSFWSPLNPLYFPIYLCWTLICNPCFWARCGKAEGRKGTLSGCQQLALLYE